MQRTRLLPATLLAGMVLAPGAPAPGSEVDVKPRTGPLPAKVRTDAGRTDAGQFGKCTPRESRSERGCDLTPPPPDEALGAPLQLERGTTVRVTLPFAARRLNLNLVVRHAEDSVSAVALGAKVASESRRRWTFEVPAAAGLDYDRLLLASTSRRGTSRTYYARVAITDE